MKKAVKKFVVDKTEVNQEQDIPIGFKRVKYLKTTLYYVTDFRFGIAAAGAIFLIDLTQMKNFG